MAFGERSPLDSRPLLLIHSAEPPLLLIHRWQLSSTGDPSSLLVFQGNA